MVATTGEIPMETGQLETNFDSGKTFKKLFRFLLMSAVFLQFCIVQQHFENFNLILAPRMSCVETKKNPNP